MRNLLYMKLNDNQLEQVVGGACVSGELRFVQRGLNNRLANTIMPEWIDERPEDLNPSSRSGKNEPGQNPQFDHFS